MQTAYEHIIDTMEKENLDIKAVAKRMGIAPYMLLRKVNENVDIKASSWMDIMQAIGYDIVMVPRNSKMDSVHVNEKRPPIKAINVGLVLSEKKMTELGTILGISRQAVNTMLRKNNDILSSRFIELADIFEYDIVMKKHPLQSI